MKMEELMKKTDAELEELELAMAMRGNLKAAVLISKVSQYRNKRVVVSRGRKVKRGTTGIVFWMGSFDNGKYDGRCGIYATVRIGIKDEDGSVYWTALQNVDLVEEEE